MKPSYKIEFQTLENETTYNTAVDVSDYINIEEISAITSDIDQGNFEIGVFNYDSINLTFDNISGIFNEPENDGRSMFPLKRDKTKVTITFTNSDGTEETTFKGLITDKSTTQNLRTHKINFTVLGLDSIFSKTSLIAGSISDGLTYKQAFAIILNVPTITNIVNYSAGNINPSLNLVIDDGSDFDALTAKGAIDQLLKASNSILLIDDSDDIIVRARTANTNTAHELFLNNQFERDNILDLNDYNNGKQRMFNSIVVNGEESKNTNSVTLNDTNQQTFSFGFITTESNYSVIAESILGTFGYPKQEILVTIDRETISGLNILDRFILDIDYKTLPRGEKYSQYDYAEYDKDYYAQAISEFRVYPIKYYKVITIKEDLKNMEYQLKLRDTGVFI